MIELRVDPELEQMIFPLTKEEFEQLEENIISDGEVYEPIIVWNGVIVDGHNRWKIIQKHPEIPFQTKSVEFKSKDEAVDWALAKQLGRRNLTDEQKTELIGKKYAIRKRMAIRNEKGQFSPSAQNEHTDKDGNRTAAVMARELGVGRETVKRAEKSANGIGELRKDNPEIATKILNGGSGVSKKEVMQYPDLSDEEKKEFVDNVINPKPKSRKTISAEEMKLRKQIEEDAIKARDKSVSVEFTIEMLIESIQISGKEYVNILKNSLVENSVLLVDENRKLISDEITSIVTQIEKIKELVK
jgi:hypothetical protein